MSEPAPDYKATLNLPRTTFPMRADLPTREAERLARWQERDLYGQLRAARAGRPRFILHDGPPYANGHIHLGTAVDKIQKDVIVRSRSMMGYDAPFVPGWDCHGMPIEINVQREFQEAGVQPGLLELRQRCRAFAEEWVAIQKGEFRRLGVAGDWDAPYLTMSRDYEAEIVETFADLVEAGYVYRGLRPIHWCVSCHTALAEAEIEYGDRTSPSITVRLPLRADPGGVFPPGAPDPAVLVWTTTPWTIPANRAVVAHPELDYVVVATDRGTLLYAAGRHEALTSLFARAEILRTVRGRDLAGLVFTHPLEDRESPLFLFEHVTLDEGTGVVHTAPGHGAEDFAVGRAHDLEIYNPVGPDGVYLPGTPAYAGRLIWEAEPTILADLEAAGQLVARHDVVHSYPHCWRCGKPVIFRATVQWFLAMDHRDLRGRTLRAIGDVVWLPPATVNRITTMVANRPDWCLSRQRAWGVGIPALYCRACEAPLVAPDFIRHVAARVRAEGADVWFAAGADELVPAGTICAGCGAADAGWRREIEILDVWFDSGVSQRAVLARHPALTWPADLYKEGPDQHRGWFNSSLILAMATRGAPPYRTVLTHGWTVDAEGKAMHKSKGNVIAPGEVIESRGADILRLWAAANEVSSDRRFSWEAIGQTVEAYRRLRNTFRFLLGNLADFDPATDVVAADALGSFDRWALADLERLSEAVREAYTAYAFQTVYQLIVNYCTVNLSGVYLDGLKVRLYTQPAASVERRGAQTVFHAALDALVRFLAPLVPFTADEVWEASPARGEAESVHLTEFPPPRPERRDVAHETEWETLLAARQAVTRELEGLRAAKTIGSSLAADVELAAPDAATHDLLVRRMADLEECFIVSHVHVRAAGDAWAGTPVETPEGFRVAVGPAAGEKCDRCWRYRTDVGAQPAHPGLCGECAAILS